MKLNTLLRFSLALVIAGAFASCSPDTVTGGNPLTEGELDASFAITGTPTDTVVMIPLSHNAQNATFVAGSDDDAIQFHAWRVSDETGTYNANNLTTVGGTSFKYTFTASGTYKIEHRVAGFVGGTNYVSEQTVTINLPAEPETGFGPNLIASPNFEHTADWKVFNTGATQTVTWAFNNGSATASGGVDNLYAGQGIYQAVQVEAGVYHIDMHVQSPGASNLMWFQVFTGTAEPHQNTDYLGDADVKIGLNTWSGCALAAFDGELSDVGCVGLGSDITFTAPQTIYFVIKCGTGAANGVNNITVSNVEMKKYQ